MLRRRRRTREIPFSFDSFLDVVANVVGIIIRLILVVWVGARSYSSLHVVPHSLVGEGDSGGKVREAKGAFPPPQPSPTRGEGDVEDPLTPDLAKQRTELDE